MTNAEQGSLRSTGGSAVKRYQRMFISLLLFAAMPVAAAFAAQQQNGSADALIGQIVEAHGGKKALSGVRSVYQRGFATLYRQDNDGWNTYYVQRPGKLRAELGLSKTPGVRLLNGPEAWASEGTGPMKKADQPHYDGLLFQYHCFELPYLLAEGGVRGLYKGTDRMNGAAVDVLELEDVKGQKLVVYSDAKTHLISKVTATLGNGPDQSVVTVEFHDYRSIKGIKAAFTLRQYAGGSAISQTRISELIFNRTMEDRLFQP